MFFFKKNDHTSKGTVAVLGTSPLAMFLVHILQQNNMDVIVLDTMKKSKSEKAENWMLKSSFQNQSFSFKYCDTLNTKPEYCFLASSFDEYKSDLLMLSDEMLTKVPVVNFASFYNHKIIEQMDNVEEIRAYFNGWLVKNKRDIIVFNRVSDVDICCERKILGDLQHILYSNKINIKERKNTKGLFWKNFIPFVLGNIFVLAYDKDVSKLMEIDDIRKEIRDASSECVKMLKQIKIEVDEAEVLPAIYAFPDGYVSEFNSLLGVSVLTDVFVKPDYFNTPVLFNVLAKAVNKY